MAPLIRYVLGENNFLMEELDPKKTKMSWQPKKNKLLQWLDNISFNNKYKQKSQTMTINYTHLSVQTFLF